MASPRCGVCGAPMRKNGKTSAGTQRWRCGACGSSAVRKIDSRAKRLGRFAGWLLGKLAQSELRMNPRLFRKKTSDFWKIWPIIPICDEVHHVVYMDGIWLSRKCVILTPVPTITSSAAISPEARTRGIGAASCGVSPLPMFSSATEEAASRRQDGPRGRTRRSKDAPSMRFAR